MVNWHLTFVEVYSESNWWFFSTKVILEEELLHYKPPLVRICFSGPDWCLFSTFFPFNFFYGKRPFLGSFNSCMLGLVWSQLPRWTLLCLVLPPADVAFWSPGVWSGRPLCYLQPQKALLHQLMTPSASRWPLWPAGEEQVSGQFRL